MALPLATPDSKKFQMLCAPDLTDLPTYPKGPVDLRSASDGSAGVCREAEGLNRTALGLHPFVTASQDYVLMGSPDKRAPKVGLGVLIFKGKKLLIGKRKGAQGSGTYALPGGHLEYLETFEDCAMRETLEETGLFVVNPRVEWVENSFFGSADNLQHYVTIFVRVDLADEDQEPQIMEPDKCEGWQWASWPDLPQPVFVPLQQMLDSTYSPKMDNTAGGLTSNH